MFTKYISVGMLSITGHLASVACGQVGDPDNRIAINMVAEWVQESQQLSDFHVVWIVENDAVDKNGVLADSFETREVCSYHWPIEMQVETSVIPQGDRFDFARASQFDHLSTIDAAGRHIETQLRVTNEQVRNGHSLREIVREQSPRAPHLLGLWLAEHADLMSGAILHPDDSVSVVLDALRLRITLVPFHGPNGNLHPVVRRLELLDDLRNPLLWWEYDDFQPVGATEYYEGRFRIQYSSSNGSLYESPPARVEESATLPPSLVLMTDAGSGASSSDPAAKNRRTPTSPLPSSPIHNRSRAWIPRALIGLGTIVLAGLGILLFIRTRNSS